MSSVREELVPGVLYTAISKYSGLIMSLIVTGVLARLIVPEKFGVVAIATVIISFFSIFSDLGIAPAIIQNKKLSDEDLSYIFTFTLWIGISISILFFLCSWPISWFYQQDSLLTICQILSLNLFFASINIVPNALIFKNKEFKFIAYRSLIVQLIGGGIAIGAALLGLGIYALIINPVFSSILLFLISYRKYPQILQRTVKISSLRKIFSFSVYQFMFNIINYFSRNIDKLLIGRYMNMNALGYYEKSYRTMMLPLQNITFVISPVMHPVFSKYQNNIKELTRSYEKVIHLLAFIGFPLSVVLWFCAYEIIIILFGEQWKPSISIFQILSLSVGVQVILSTAGSIFQAANDTKNLFICGIFSTLLNVSGILIGIFFFQTLNAVAWCVCVTFNINFIQSYLIMYKVTLKQSIRPFLEQLISPFILTFILILALIPIYIIQEHFHILVSLLIKVGLFIFICFIYIQISGEYNIIKLIKAKIKR